MEEILRIVIILDEDEWRLWARYVKHRNRVPREGRDGRERGDKRKKRGGHGELTKGQLIAYAKPLK